VGCCWITVSPAWAQGLPKLAGLQVIPDDSRTYSANSAGQARPGTRILADRDNQSRGGW
jgi:hypothetical protein